jgi:hypothetical protein
MNHEGRSTSFFMMNGCGEIPRDHTIGLTSIIRCSQRKVEQHECT